MAKLQLNQGRLYHPEHNNGNRQQLEQLIRRNILFVLMALRLRLHSRFEADHIIRYITLVCLVSSL